MGHRSSSLRRATNERFTQVREVEAIIEHFAWNSGRLKNDISLLKLKTPIDFSPGVQPIHLPTAEFRSDKDSPQRTDIQSQVNGPICLISGYGTIKFEGSPPDMLQQA